MKRISFAIMLVVIAAVGMQALADNTTHAFLNNRVSLTLERTDVEAVVRMLAKQHGFNVAIAGEVTGEASMILNNVPLHEALDAILLSNNLSWYMKENLMVVKPSGFLASDERVTALVTPQARYLRRSEVGDRASAVDRWQDRNISGRRGQCRRVGQRRR